MHYHIGDLARIFGVSNQSLHFYEEKGVLSAENRTENGYRSYNLLDFYKLGAIKRLRNAGFTLKEIPTVQNAEHTDQVSACYRNKKAELQKELDILCMQCEQLDMHIDLLAQYEQSPNTMLVKQLPPFYRFESSAGLEILDQEMAVKKASYPWFRAMFYTCYSGLFILDRETHKITEMTNGLIATEEICLRLSLPTSPCVKKIPSGTYLSCMMKNTPPYDVVAKAYHAYLENPTYPMRGEPFTRSIASGTDDDNQMYYITELLIPIELAESLDYQVT